MKTIILILTFCLSAFSANSQATFEKTYKTKPLGAHDMGGAGMGNSPSITHDLGSSFIQTADGGFISLGSTEEDSTGLNMLVIKTNEYGNVSWIKKIGGSGNDFGKSIQQTFDGGFIIAGGTESIGAGGMDIQLTKLDSAGNQVWTKVFGMTGNEEAQALKQTTDGGFVMVGKTNSWGSGMEDVYVIRTDSTGVILWTKVFGGSDIDFANDVIETMDGGYLVAGATKSFGAGNMDAYMIKVDSLGNRTWEKTIGDSTFNCAQSVLQTADGEFVVVGTTMSFGNSDVYLMKLSSNGVGIWTKSYGGLNTEKGNAVSIVGNSYVIVGETSSFGAGGSDVLLFKTDENGGLIFAKAFGTDENEFATSVSKTTDGGFFMGGCVVNVIGSESIYVVKTDSLASTSCSGAEASMATNMVASSSWTPMGAYVNATYFTAADTLSTLSTLSTFGSTVYCSNEPVDTTPSLNVVYTQLMTPISEDDDNGSSLSKIVGANVAKDSLKNSFSVYPNPSDGSVINVSMDVAKAETVVVVVYDMLGKEKYSNVIAMENEGTNVFAIDPSGMLTPGVYMITATSSESTLSKRLVVK